jgi:hypothetical protein
MHQAAVLALTNINANVSSLWKMGYGLLPYLSQHGQRIRSMKLHCLCVPRVTLPQLGPMVQLNSLELHHFGLQLQAGDGVQGVLGLAGLPLKQLRLKSCNLLCEQKELAGALSQLPGLEHLSLHNVKFRREGFFGEIELAVGFPAEMAQPLQQLTYLDIVGLHDPDMSQQADEAEPVLQPLQALTWLAHLRVVDQFGVHTLRLEANTLPSSHLTHVELTGRILYEPGALAGKTRLQHLDLPSCSVPYTVISDAAAGVAQLLLELQLMEQLTHLNLAQGLFAVSEDSPPVAAFAALTASSRIRHLDISGCKLPKDVWEHVFPTGKSLPQLQILDISRVREPLDGSVAAPACSRLVSCCPHLQSLYMLGLECGVGQLAFLSLLTGLHTLHVTVDEDVDQQALDCCQLTGLRELNFDDDSYADSDGLLLQLTKLRQLTRLSFTAVKWNVAPQLVWESQKTLPCQVSLAMCEMCALPSVCLCRTSCYCQQQ